MDFVADFPISPRLREPLAAALRGKASDWPDSLSADEVDAIVAHGMGPLVYASAALLQLRSEALRASALEPLRAADLAEVLAALAPRGVQPLITKGTALAYDIYDAPELRPRSDTDLLIAREDLPVLRETMLALGFEEVPSSGDEHGLRQAVFTRAPGMVYDVHWAATNVPAFDAVLRYHDLRTRAIAIPPLGNHARGLSRVDALLMACIHRVAHHHDSDRLIWLADIALLRERLSREEHARFWRFAAQGRVVAVCSHSIAVAGQWLSRTPHDLAEEWLSAGELSREEPSRVFLDRDITHGRVMAANLRALPWHERVERLWQLAFPPAEYMRGSFNTRSALLLPLLYVYRGMRGIARLFKRAAR
ncbi:MAG TPA: nucleotidyltransferase family protein [Thermoanaerobaculia bacterium]|nr:nucleotidyltransferase family protein [Thermoanaerobaculia bacterium]